MIKNLHPIETINVVPDSQWEFGYFGRHHIVAMPGDAIPREIDRAKVPHFFELQIKTLFQHAWSEANHDLGYKPSTPLNDDQLRRLAFTSAQAWGATSFSEELFEELKKSSKAALAPVRENARTGFSLTLQNMKTTLTSLYQTTVPLQI